MLTSTRPSRMRLRLRSAMTRRMPSSSRASSLAAASASSRNAGQPIEAQFRAACTRGSAKRARSCSCPIPPRLRASSSTLKNLFFHGLCSSEPSALIDFSSGQRVRTHSTVNPLSAFTREAIGCARGQRSDSARVTALIASSTFFSATRSA